MPQLDHRLDADDPPARRSPHVDDRPEDGRAQPLQVPAAPDAPGCDRHAQGRGDLGLGGREDGGALSPVCPRRRAARQRLQPVGRRRTDGANSAGGRRGTQADSNPHPVHRDRGRRVGRPDDDRRQGGRRAHHPLGAKEPGGRHPPRAGHAKADGRCHHRPDQVEPARPNRLPSGQPHRQPRGARRNGRRQAVGQRRHALPLAGHQHAAPRPGHLPERRRNQKVIAAVATTEPEFVKELVQLKTTLPDGDKKRFSDRDDLYEAAIDIVVREGRGSVSLLQRSLGIGYGRAARLIDFMAEDGIVGPYNGSQAREILMTLEQWEQITGQGSGGADAQRNRRRPRRSGKIVCRPARFAPSSRLTTRRISTKSRR